MSNILTGIIKIIAPGADATFKKVEAGVKNLDGSLNKLQTNVQAFGGGVKTFTANNNLLTTGLTKTTSAAGGFASKIGIARLGVLGWVGIAAAAITIGKKLYENFNKQSEKAKEAAEANKKLARSIVGSLAQLTTLVGVIKNVNTSQEERVRALKAVNDQYSKYLPQLEKEKITLDNISVAYDKIIDSILRQAVVKGLQKEIEKAVEETAAAIIKLQIEEEKHNRQKEKSVEITKKEINLQDDVTKGLQRYNNTVKDGYIAQSQANAEQQKGLTVGRDYSALYQKLKDNLKAGLSPLLSLSTALSDLDIDIKDPKINVDPDKIDDWIAPLFKLTPIRLEKLSFDFSNVKIVLLGGQVKTLQQKVDDNITKEIEKLVVKPKINLSPKGIANVENFKAMQDAAKSMSDAFTQGLQGFATEGLATVGEAIGTALSGGDIGNVFKNFANILAEGFISIGKQLIAASPIIAGLKIALKSLNPVLLIAAGVGLVAIGSALRSSVGKGISGARADGGPVSGGQTYLVGERGPELFTPSTGGGITPNHQLGGRGSSVAGGMAVQVSGQFLQRGQDLLAVIALANQSSNRLGG